LDKGRKHFSVGEFKRKCLQHTVQEIYPEKFIIFNIICLAPATMTQRGEDLFLSV
jgi:hypothetical protein